VGIEQNALGSPITTCGEYDGNVFSGLSGYPLRAAESGMLQTWRKPAKLFSDFNTLQFAGVMGMVFFVFLFLFIPAYSEFPKGLAVDLAHVLHSVSMPSANREDAMIVTVTRDGKVYFGTEIVRIDDLQQKITDRLKDGSVERKVYVRADMRARWGLVDAVLGSVRSAGVLRVAFLVQERRTLSARF